MTMPDLQLLLVAIAATLPVSLWRTALTLLDAAGWQALGWVRLRGLESKALVAVMLAILARAGDHAGGAAALAELAKLPSCATALAFFYRHWTRATSSSLPSGDDTPPELQGNARRSVTNVQVPARYDRGERSRGWGG
jgi:hypothetical protein